MRRGPDASRQSYADRVRFHSRIPIVAMHGPAGPAHAQAGLEGEAAGRGALSEGQKFAGWAIPVM